MSSMETLQECGCQCSVSCCGTWLRLLFAVSAVGFRFSSVCIRSEKIRLSGENNGDITLSLKLSWVRNHFVLAKLTKAWLHHCWGRHSARHPWSQICYLHTWIYSRVAWGISRGIFLNKRLGGCWTSAAAHQRLPDLTSREQSSVMSHHRHVQFQACFKMSAEPFMRSFFKLKYLFFFEIPFLPFQKDHSRS